ncbi:MAG: ABC transporter substrate-binding protein, partial [Corynebacteriales bacterium]|nr:ABC transporter substrate-binding protein [Mycobacteriales bacterium]
MHAWRRVAALTTLALALGLATAACSDSKSDSGGQVSVFTTRPENPLNPLATTEVGGGRIIRSMFTGLTSADPDTAEMKNAMAESIETTDSQNYTIALKRGWKFHDGSEVKAKNFVDAWNYAAYTPNGMQNAPFYENIEGFDQVHTIDPDQEGPEQAPTPPSEKMSGLEIIDDYTFKVKLTSPLSIFTTKISYVAFYPMPDVFFTN